MKQNASKPEDRFRAELLMGMKNQWMVTRHENRPQVSPGTPDLSYVMKGGGYETGWLELKASDETDPEKKILIGLEPSQHQWIEKHHRSVPVYVLYKRGSKVYLISGSNHHSLAIAAKESDLRMVAMAVLEDGLDTQLLGNGLRYLTDRKRNG